MLQYEKLWQWSGGSHLLLPCVDVLLQVCTGVFNSVQFAQTYRKPRDLQSATCMVYLCLQIFLANPFRYDKHLTSYVWAKSR